MCKSPSDEGEKFCTQTSISQIADDILKLSKGSKNIALVEKILKKLDKENKVLKLEKGKYTIKECEWLDHRKTTSGIIHLVRKTERIDN